MGGVVLKLARALVVAPFVFTAILAVLDYPASAASFGAIYPQLAGLYPVLLIAQACVGLVLVVGLPPYRWLALLLAVIVVAIAFWRAPFWNVLGSERVMLTNLFMGVLAQAGGLLLIAAMPKR